MMPPQINAFFTEGFFKGELSWPGESRVRRSLVNVAYDASGG
jgi:hypothetical protein